jgi:lipoprotein-anchoring transpeptidase ErfK/SrfK
MIYVNLEGPNLIFRSVNLSRIEYSGDRTHQTVQHYLSHESVTCGIGEEAHPTPKGIFMIVRKLIDPGSYYTGDHPERYGSCVLELNISDLHEEDGEMHPYCIHGTDLDSNLGTKHTRGCITLKDDALKFMFNHVEKGEEVIIWDCSWDQADRDKIPNWRQIRIWPPPENSVSYRRNVDLI